MGSYYGPATVENCSFVANHSDRPGTAGFGCGGPTYIRNSLFWGNTNSEGRDEYSQIHAPEGTHIDFSIVEGWTGKYEGVGTTGLDPLLLDPDGPDGLIGTLDDNVRLSLGSPAINGGDPDTASLLPTDLDGHARVLCGAVDIGAYEFGIGDFNCDQAVDLLDQAIWNDCMTNPRPSAVRPGCEAFDFNADSGIDLSDFAEFQNLFSGQVE
jgi:hypothetical protein